MYLVNLQVSQIREDESKYHAVFGRKVSFNIDYVFLDLKLNDRDAKQILFVTENWFDWSRSEIPFSP